jgi:hypothetical protein
MGRGVPPNVFKYVVLAVVVAMIAAPPLFIALGLVALAADQPGGCGGG